MLKSLFSKPVGAIHSILLLRNSADRTDHPYKTPTYYFICNGLFEISYIPKNVVGI